MGRHDKNEQLAIAERRRKVAALYLRRVTQEEIARQLDVDQATISRDIAALKAQWKAETSDLKDREVADLEEMERECAINGSNAKGKGAEWMRARLAVKERRAKLLGLDAPTKVAPTDPTGERPYADLTDNALDREIGRLLAAAVGRATRGDGDGEAVALDAPGTAQPTPA